MCRRHALKSACNATRPHIHDCHAAVCRHHALNVNLPVMQPDHTSMTVVQQCANVMALNVNMPVMLPEAAGLR